jgi:hypothetical protein
MGFGESRVRRVLHRHRRGLVDRGPDERVTEAHTRVAQLDEPAGRRRLERFGGDGATLGDGRCLEDRPQARLLVEGGDQQGPPRRFRQRRSPLRERALERVRDREGSEDR